MSVIKAAALLVVLLFSATAVSAICPPQLWTCTDWSAGVCGERSCQHPQMCDEGRPVESLSCDVEEDVWSQSPAVVVVPSYFLLRLRHGEYDVPIQVINQGLESTMIDIEGLDDVVSSSDNGFALSAGSTSTFTLSFNTTSMDGPLRVSALRIGERVIQVIIASPDRNLSIASDALADVDGKIGFDMNMSSQSAPVVEYLLFADDGTGFSLGSEMVDESDARLVREVFVPDGVSQGKYALCAVAGAMADCSMLELRMSEPVAVIDAPEPVESWLVLVYMAAVLFVALASIVFRGWHRRRLR
ncbi:MAG: hypothetical protein ABIH41_04500 [Nanoarchaeota archaeon]